MLNEVERIKLMNLAVRAAHVACCSGVLALVVFALLWALAVSGCCSPERAVPPEPAPAAVPADGPGMLSGRIAHVVAEMRLAGCWPETVDVSCSGPAAYAFSVRGPFYDRLATNAVAEASR